MSNVAECNHQNPDIVFVGGGPVGLWTAIQTKLLTNKNILIVEKYLEYKRADIRLNLEASSFRGVPDYEPLKALIQKWGDRVVPIKEMEEGLTACAHGLGVTILKGKAADPKLLQQEYPKAKLFIGADGAKSAMRRELFGDAYKFNTPLQYLVQVQYQIKTPEAEQKRPGFFRKLMGSVSSYTKQKFAGHLITQIIRPQENGQSQVTLRIFVTKKTYEAMADAVFSNPYYFETDLNKVPSSLKKTLIKWWGAQKDQEIIGDVEKANKITVIPLASYAAKEPFKMVEKERDPDDSVGLGLVGDASQGYPFFRAINNGLLLGTRLAQCTGRAFEALKKEKEQNGVPDGPEKQRRAALFASKFTSYSRYSTIRAYIERIRALVKDFFISLSSLWFKFINYAPVAPIKLGRAKQRAAARRGGAIWRRLTGVKL